MYIHTFRFSLRLGILFIACAILYGANVPRAGAQDHVWFEAVPVSDGALVLDQGPGVALALACDTTMQPEDPEFLWDITMRFQNILPLYGWTMNLRSVSDSLVGIEYEYGEKVFSASGHFQGYVPLPSVFTSALLGQARELTQNVGMHSLTPSQTYEASADGVAWSVFKIRISKTLSDVDSGFVGIYGETGLAGWADEIGWGSAIIGDNDEMEVWNPGTRYPNPLITIDCPQGASWSPGIEGSLYAPAPPPPEDPPADEPSPTEQPPVSPPPGDGTPTNPPSGDPEIPSNDNGNATPPIPPDANNPFITQNYDPNIFAPPIAPTAPAEDEIDSDDAAPPASPLKPLPGSDSLVAQCGMQSSLMLMMTMAGAVCLRTRLHRRRLR